MQGEHDLKNKYILTYMKARTILLILLCAVGMTSYANEKIYVNRDVTTHIVMPEPIKLVDISTPKIAGNQCTDNIVRIKPYHDEGDSIRSGGYTENELLGTITLIGERHIAQYDVLYTEEPGQAAAIFEVPYTHTQSYINPEVTMPMSEMARYAWAVYGSRRKYNQIVTRAHGMKATVNNIYAVGDYFFIDFSVRNKTKIPYDIEEIRVKLTDKKETKATNSQTIELSPVFTLNSTRKFRKDYRNVMVLPKLTFPDEKVLRIEISENQISGRVIVLTLEYEDILHADGFDADILKDAAYYPYYHISYSDNDEEVSDYLMLCGRFHWRIRTGRQAGGKRRLPVPVHPERNNRLRASVVIRECRGTVRRGRHPLAGKGFLERLLLGRRHRLQAPAGAL